MSPSAIPVIVNPQLREGTVGTAVVSELCPSDRLHRIHAGDPIRFAHGQWVCAPCGARRLREGA